MGDFGIIRHRPDDFGRNVEARRRAGIIPREHRSFPYLKPQRRPVTIDKMSAAAVAGAANKARRGPRW
jgi:hypothetical protein